MALIEDHKSLKKGKGRLKREATEAEIINAFDRVVRRDGLRNVGVNAVIKEAGIGKGLLYNYFGGLPGLVQAWGERMNIWPDREALLGHLSGLDSKEVDPHELIKTITLNHAASLREHPLRIELLADEVMSDTSISEALSDVRAQLGREHQDIFRDLETMLDDDSRSLLMILMAAGSYLGMRSEKSPSYMGEDIHTAEGWAQLLKRFERIMDLVELGLKIEGVMSHKNSPS